MSSTTTPELGMGIQSPSLFDALKPQWPDTHIDFHQGVPISGPIPPGITDAVASARAATSASSQSETGPACSGAAPLEKDATCRT